MAARVPDFVAFHAAAQPHALAAVDLSSGRDWTYAGFDQAIARCVTALCGLEVTPGQRVSLLARNSVGQLMVRFACARLGAIFVPLNWRLAAPELQALCDDCQPALLLFDEACAATASQLATSGARMGMEEWMRRSSLAVPAAPHPLPEDDCTVLLYTSGTSGRPKAVQLTERNIFFTAANFGLLGRVARQSVFLCESPMFHIIGLITSISTPLMYGGTIVVSDGFDPVRTNERLRDPQLGISHYFCVPQVAERLLAAPGFDAAALARLTGIFTGGAPLNATCVDGWLENGVAIVNGYGMTEVGTVSGMPVDLDMIRARPASVGLVPPTQSLRIVDGDGQDVRGEAIGELLLQGPNVSPGYRSPCGGSQPAADAQGWFRTGDLGFRDAQGFITLVDRSKDMFISGGENVYPAEVEAALLQHPDVCEAAVIGVPSAHWGEVGHGFVVLRSQASLDAERLAAHCALRIARYKIPTSFSVVDALPRTGSGKILKHVLRETLRALPRSA